MGKADLVKEKIIFVISRMSIGGSQKSLVNVLRIIDYDKYDVSLYVRENKTDLLKDIPDSVKVTVNTNKRRYEHTPYTLFLYVLELIFSFFNQKDISKKFSKKSQEYIVKRKEKYEKSHYSIFNEKYDIAISYLQGFTCKFTEDCVIADRKICFFHNSTDALPDIHKEYLNRFEKVVVVSEETKDFLKKRYPEINNKLLVIKNLMDIEGIRKKASETIIEKNTNQLMLCTCGRVSKEKGYDLAVDVARHLKDNDISFIWYFVGDGPEMKHIQDMVDEYKLNDEVILLGSQDNPYPWIAQCDIYVQPSYEEAQGLTIMEAQFFDVPIVSTKTVGAQELICSEQNGLLVDINDYSVFAGIMRLIQNPQTCDKYKINLKKINYQDYNSRIQYQWKALLSGNYEKLS